MLLAHPAPHLPLEPGHLALQVRDAVLQFPDGPVLLRHGPGLGGKLGFLLFQQGSVRLRLKGGYAFLALTYLAVHPVSLFEQLAYEFVLRVLHGSCICWFSLQRYGFFTTCANPLI